MISLRIYKTPDFPVYQKNELFIKLNVMTKNSCGMTLIELLIVLCMLGILYAIAYPNYFSYLIATRRIDGKTALLDLSSRMESYYTINNSYPTDIRSILNSDVSPEGWYKLKISSSSESSYALEASPQRAQVADSGCNVLTLDHLGVKGRSGTAAVEKCW